MTARELLGDECSVASVVCLAAEKELGDGWLLWEPESIWLELHHRGIEVPVSNRQQMLAGRSVITTGRLFYDAQVFDRTSAAFANDPCDHDSFDGAFVAQHAWCVEEVLAISEHARESVLHYDREVVSLIAQCLFSEGFVLAPESLHFTQESLDRLYGSSEKSSELKKVVAEVWASAKGLSVRNIPYPETARGVQMARLASVEAYLTERRSTRAKQRAAL